MQLASKQAFAPLGIYLTQIKMYAYTKNMYEWSQQFSLKYWELEMKIQLFFNGETICKQLCIYHMEYDSAI